ncbi:Outer membrane porin protein [Cupriavidus laharis]|uniref:Outer membrane porin protein n=1 Tax=Cupriavidus laharis TaxID=151654 RepID=A0ABN7Z7J0_9BURK|nr:porin [Cupriavidus laharis]CAG9181223.1 Outer membrane porin protein [Cupriavidus laharis]
MTRRTIRLAGVAALCGAAATATAAQGSNVTLYGRVVAGVDVQTNVQTTDGGSGTLWRGADNQWGTSMFGLQGTEDLGGGLKGLFHLESGFGAAKGKTNGDALFNRRAYIGLQGGWGKLTMGKNQPIADALWALDPTGQQFIGSATLVRGRNWQGHDNMVAYETPNLGGFSALALTSLGEQPGSASKLRKDALSLTYTAPAFELRAIYDVARDANGKYSDLFNTSKELTLGGTLSIRDFKLFAGYENLSAPDSPAGAPTKANHFWLGANYQLTPALTLIGAFYRVMVNRGGGNANLYMLGANYNLSKRTLLYASVGTVQNSANANFSVEATNNNPAPGRNQLGAYTGIAHSF